MVCDDATAYNQEACNGVDDDCDGETDEESPNLCDEGMICNHFSECVAGSGLSEAWPALRCDLIPWDWAATPGLEGHTPETGTYWLDPTDQESSTLPPFLGHCNFDVDTDKGGWTRVWLAESGDLGPDDSLGWDPGEGASSSQTAFLLEDDADGPVDFVEVLLAYVYSDAPDTIVPNSWARMPLPDVWRQTFPLAAMGGFDHTTAMVGVDGAHSPVTLRYGRAVYSEAGLEQFSCGAPWSSEALGVPQGRICVEGTSAPYYSGFADAEVDYCAPSNAADLYEGAGLYECSPANRRFALFVRTRICDDQVPSSLCEFDGDGDGFPFHEDCDDSDALAFPGAAFYEASEGPCMRDADKDGYGDANPGPGIEPGTDCDDDDFYTAPYRGSMEADFQPCRTDADGDGYGDADPEPGVEPGSDCDDDKVDVNPGAEEICGDATDNDCVDGVDNGCP